MPGVNTLVGGYCGAQVTLRNGMRDRGQKKNQDQPNTRAAVAAGAAVPAFSSFS